MREAWTLKLIFGILNNSLGLQNYAFRNFRFKKKKTFIATGFSQKTRLLYGGRHGFGFANRSSRFSGF